MGQWFGTDGIRGQVGEAPMTAAFVLQLGWAAGRVLAAHGSREVLIGKDTRLSGYLFESALESGLASAGVNARLVGPMPTPAIAYLTRTFRQAAGIVISASHNPFDDNGVKFFSAEGGKLPDALEAEIEAMMDEPMTTVGPGSLGRATRVDDARGRYIEFCKGTVAFGTSLRGLRLVVDCAHGATYQVAPQVFRELGAEVLPIGVDPDGLNINRDCGATSPETLAARVITAGADAGIALDGDGDRLIMVDSAGEIVDGDMLLLILARARQAAGDLDGGVVGTLMSNLGLARGLQQLGIPFERAAVGDRFVLEQLEARGWKLGGESSGHIICRDRTTTGDGIVSALQVLQEMTRTGSSLDQLAASFEHYPQKLVNVRVAERVDPGTDAAVRAEVERIETRLGETGRVLLRASGTEPKVRVMIEGPDAADLDTLAQQLADTVRAQFGERAAAPPIGSD
jgi:phosphoglucosamine mutase